MYCTQYTWSAGILGMVSDVFSLNMILSVHIVRNTNYFNNIIP